jgi:hypothetical protein
MRNPMLDTHIAAVIAMTIFCPFQMAMLTIPMSDHLEKMAILPQIQNRTYLRRTIKSDAPAKATYEMV